MVWRFKRKRKRESVPVTIEVSFGTRREREAYALLGKRYEALDRHFELTEQLRNTYTPSSEAAVEKGIRICRRMIAVSSEAKSAWLQQEADHAKARRMLGDKGSKPTPLPLHAGFQQLAIILEKRGELEEAIKVAKQAQSQGWNGDWEKRIARCEAKLAKLNSAR